LVILRLEPLTEAQILRITQSYYSGDAQRFYKEAMERGLVLIAADPYGVLYMAILPHYYHIRPDNAEALEAALRLLIPRDKTHGLDVIVLDMTPPAGTKKLQRYQKRIARKEA
jgi:hypothetical protein